MSNIY